MRTELVLAICLFAGLPFRANAGEADNFDFRLSRDVEKSDAQLAPPAPGGQARALLQGKVLFSHTVNDQPTVMAAPSAPSLAPAAEPVTVRVWERFSKPDVLPAGPDALAAPAAPGFATAVVTTPKACAVSNDPIQTRPQAWEYAYKLMAYETAGCGPLIDSPPSSLHLIEPAEKQQTLWNPNPHAQPETAAGASAPQAPGMAGIQTGPPACDAPTGGQVGTFSKNPGWSKAVENSTIAWPIPKPEQDTTLFWHRWDEFTGLDAGLGMVQKNPNANMEVLIAHLDTGYPDPTTHPNYPFPANLNVYGSADCYASAALGIPTTSGESCIRGPICVPPGASDSDKEALTKAWAYTQAGGIDQSEHDTSWNDTTFFERDPYHGSGTLVILAGPFVGQDGIPLSGCLSPSTPHWGANPCAKVIEVRVGPGFLHLNEDSLAAGIHYAVEDAHADVISLSHGGLPSGVLSDAVDDAYNKGVPIFAASGDFKILLPPFTIFGSTPKTVVFPARYSQVIDVTGVTAANSSGGEPCSFFQCLSTLVEGQGLWANLSEWSIGTNFGPSEIMKGHTIAAYTPNITTYDVDLQTPGLSNKEIGTSAATPQVAAAAAMWLELNGSAVRLIPKTWQRTEAVYAALLSSAAAVSNNYPLPPGYTEYQRAQYYADYFGSGILNVPALLAQPVQAPPASARRCHSRDDPYWIADAVASLGQIYEIVGIPPEQRTPESDALLARGIRTEMMQLSAQSTSFTQASIEMTDSTTPADSTCDAHAQFGPNSKTKVQALNETLQADRNASPTLKKLFANMARQWK